MAAQPELAAGCDNFGAIAPAVSFLLFYFTFIFVEAPAAVVGKVALAASPELAAVCEKFGAIAPAVSFFFFYFILLLLKHLPRS